MSDSNAPNSNSGLSVFKKSSRVEAPPADVFAWHERPGAFRRLMPPWEYFEPLESTGLRDGGHDIFRVKFGPLPFRWVAEYRDVDPPRGWVDEQTRGPFARWTHRHTFEPDGTDATTHADDIRYRLRVAPLSNLLFGGMARRKIERTFAYRHATLAADLAAHRRAGLAAPQRILVSGSTGLVGSALVPFLRTGGHTVQRLVRGVPTARQDGSESIAWDPATGFGDELAPLDGLDAVVHLAGAGIADKRWSAERKKAIRDSRIEGTRRLCLALARLERKPRVLVCASAIGYYGNRGDDELSESADPGTDFLAGVCREWEEATEPAARAGIRVVHLRFGMIASPAGGALKKMLLPFLLGAGGPVGSGRQWISWIGIDDVVGAILHAIATDALRGPVNCVAPNPVRNSDFGRALGRVLRRPAFLPLPAFQARLMFGEVADAILLASQRVRCDALRASGYEFRHAELEPMLRHVLGR